MFHILEQIYSCVCFILITSAYCYLCVWVILFNLKLLIRQDVTADAFAVRIVKIFLTLNRWWFKMLQIYFKYLPIIL